MFRLWCISGCLTICITPSGLDLLKQKENYMSEIILDARMKCIAECVPDEAVLADIVPDEVLRFVKADAALGR